MSMMALAGRLPIRRVIYTTNANESVNSQLRKIIKSRDHFPSDDAAMKLIWLALKNITADWGRCAKQLGHPVQQCIFRSARTLDRECLLFRKLNIGLRAPGPKWTIAK